MQFIFNFFGTVHATKDVGKQHHSATDVGNQNHSALGVGNRGGSGLYILDEKIRVLSNHVDFLLQQHFSQQTVTLKTCDEYTSEDVGCEDSESGRDDGASATGEEDGGSGEVHEDLPAGNTETGRDGAGEGQAGTGPSETPADETRAHATDSH